MPYADPDKRKAHDNRKRPEHDNRKRPGRPPGPPAPTLCLDGEGEDHPDGSHHYTFLAASTPDGRFKASIDGVSLSTRQCLDFLLGLPRTYRKVAFSFDYDMNMILKDLPPRYLYHLLTKKRVCWNGYKIMWLKRKQYCITKQGKGGGSVCIWDMFGYFQRGFAKVLNDWQVGTLEERKAVSDMKGKRSGFSGVDNQLIWDYCLLECRLGATVFEKLLACVDAVDLKLMRYDGAGSVAAAMLRKHGVAAFKEPEADYSLPPEIALAAYYGGRFDLAEFGEIGDSFEYDINSAYPHIARHLPCLLHAEWEYTKHPFLYGQLQPGIYHVSWSRAGRWAPFPYRKGSKIHYLASGAGWYHSSEINAVLAYGAYPVDVDSGYILRRNCSHTPMAFIDGYYHQRQLLEARGDLAQMVLKLGLNSVYGKTAQNRGSYSKKPPTYRSFIWAGMITAGARAMLTEAMNLAGADGVLVATDAIFSRLELPLPLGTELGQWKAKDAKGLFIVQNGVYETSGTKQATRGYNPLDVDFEWSKAQLARGLTEFDIPVRERKFVGLGDALPTWPPGQAFDHWRNWEIDCEQHCQSYIKFGVYPDKVISGYKLTPKENAWAGRDSDPFKPDA